MGCKRIKAGLLEIADLFVVNKSDRPGADQAVRQLEFLLELEGGERSGWTVPVLRTNGLDGEGLDVLFRQIRAHWLFLNETGELQVRHKKSVRAALSECLRHEMSRRIHHVMKETDAQISLERIESGALTPRAAARLMLNRLATGFEPRSHSEMVSTQSD